MEYDKKYMRRALELAARGRGMTAANPMVGAVIVAPDGRIIGEGWHRRYGEGHAEVNAVASVSPTDRPLLTRSTIYVTLEPCSHYGKTPPCAKLLVDSHIPRVVVGAGDPNPKVNGRGIAMLREAGAEVVTGVLERESQQLNYVFFTAMRHRRPFVMLKWAQSADGYMDCRRAAGMPPCHFSNALTSAATMKLRAEAGAIVTTAATVSADNARLTLRDWPGNAPQRFIVDRRGVLTRELAVFQEGAIPPVVLCNCESPDELWRTLYDDYHITSVLVEAGPRFLDAILTSGQWDALRVEIAPFALGAEGEAPAPPLPHAPVISDSAAGANRLLLLSNNPLFCGADS